MNMYEYIWINKYVGKLNYNPGKQPQLLGYMQPVEVISIYLCDSDRPRQVGTPFLTNYVSDEIMFFSFLYLHCSCCYLQILVRQFVLWPLAPILKM